MGIFFFFFNLFFNFLMLLQIGDQEDLAKNLAKRKIIFEKKI
jgi:hypothetical protein